MIKRKSFNPKRHLAEPGQASRLDLEGLASRATYTGNPEHKRDPGDFGLVPPAAPRRAKTLCDGAGVDRRAEAEALLREGLRKGMVSRQLRGDWPQNVWAIGPGDIAFEGQLENEAAGEYHGYPMPDADDFRLVILRAWRERPA